jgi:single-stranded DNA-binding protein
LDGRLEWREWETDDGQRRQAVEIVADQVQFLGSPTRARLEEESTEDVREALVSEAAES